MSRQGGPMYWIAKCYFLHDGKWKEDNLDGLSYEIVYQYFNGKYQIYRMNEAKSYFLKNKLDKIYDDDRIRIELVRPIDKFEL